ncbi:uncharacterized protein RHO25_009000 [Cercospora beticola]|uniref:Uncharacterized protein n=1 Tax=Cercospora beticola TaxID=122368 RepID=A0ABZ0NY70_CERBT|nr:hypothetical protein RHO25_009000 [Cercospora beticola]CAK1356824.1 unnamed protein product [Cercospora beticola]
MSDVDTELELESDEELVEVYSDRVEVSEDDDDAPPVLDAENDVVVDKYWVDEEEGPVLEDVSD